MMTIKLLLFDELSELHIQPSFEKQGPFVQTCLKLNTVKPTEINFVTKEIYVKLMIKLNTV